jgi:hypothetical protein
VGRAVERSPEHSQKVLLPHSLTYRRSSLSTVIDVEELPPWPEKEAMFPLGLLDISELLRFLFFRYTIDTYLNSCIEFCHHFSNIFVKADGWT